MELQQVFLTCFEIGVLAAAVMYLFAYFGGLVLRFLRGVV